MAVCAGCHLSGARGSPARAPSDSIPARHRGVPPSAAQPQNSWIHPQGHVPEESSPGGPGTRPPPKDAGERPRPRRRTPTPAIRNGVGTLTTYVQGSVRLRDTDKYQILTAAQLIVTRAPLLANGDSLPDPAIAPQLSVAELSSMIKDGAVPLGNAVPPDAALRASSSFRSMCRRDHSPHRPCSRPSSAARGDVPDAGQLPLGFLVVGRLTAAPAVHRPRLGGENTRRERHARCLPGHD